MPRTTGAECQSVTAALFTHPMKDLAREALGESQQRGEINREEEELRHIPAQANSRGTRNPQDGSICPQQVHAAVLCRYSDASGSM